MAPGGETTLTENPRRRVDESSLLEAADRWLPAPAVNDAGREIAGWAGYARQAPAVLAGLARRAGVEAIVYQDESGRFGLESFKGWGGGYAAARVLARRAAARAGAERLDTAELAGGRHRHLTADVTLACATDGNHGTAVAWAARSFGGRAIVYVADIVSHLREARIRDLGATVVRSAGNHEVASAECVSAARANGWFVITETENATEPEIAADTLAGYGALWEEAFDGLDRPPTHLFVQAGVGGLSAAAAGIGRRRYGALRPTLTVVEAEPADCIRRSLAAGRRVSVEGHFDTRLAGLAAGATSTFAWDLLSAGADFAMTIRDDSAEETMRVLAQPDVGDPEIVGGGSGVAGLAGALLVCGNPEFRGRLGIGADSRILVIGTEGATDPERYRAIVGS
jgi:diaminopropionate ammonia-lyase